MTDFDIEKHAKYISDQIDSPEQMTIGRKLADRKCGPRGFVVVECVKCPFREPRLGGYDREEIRGYSCMLYGRVLDGENGVFPTWCGLKSLSMEWVNLVRKYGSLVEYVESMREVIEG